MVRTPQRQFETEILAEFRSLHAELEIYFSETVDHLIHSAMHSDGDDAGLEAAQLT